MKNMFNFLTDEDNGVTNTDSNRGLFELSQPNVNLSQKHLSIQRPKPVGLDTPAVKKEGWSINDYNTTAQTGLGAMQLGLGLASYLTQSRVAGKQMRQMDQQYEANKGLIADRRANQAATAKFAASFTGPR